MSLHLNTPSAPTFHSRVKPTPDCQGQNLSRLPKIVGLPDKFTIHQVAHSWPGSTYA